MLPREYYKDPEFDLTKTFPGDPDMHIVNRILDKSLVERPDQCLSGARDLLLMIDEYVMMISNRGQLLSADVPRPCHVCGYGQYKVPSLGNNLATVSLRFWGSSTETTNLSVYPFACSSCGHIEFFTSPAPTYLREGTG
jgi:hypothetical protein